MPDIDLGPLTPRSRDALDRVVVIKEVGAGLEEAGLIPISEFAVPGANVADGDYGVIVVTGGVWSLDDNAVTNANLSDMATGTIKGRSTAGTGDPEDLTGAQVAALLPNVSLTSPGLAPKIERGISRVYMFDDMTSNVGEIDWTVANSGTGAGQSALGEPTGAGGMGWLSFGLGTTATGRTARFTTATSINFTNGKATYICRGQVGALSTGTETYTARWGFHDSPSAESVDGAFFRYTHGVNGGKFQAVTRANNVETAVDTGITAAISTDYKFEIVVDASVPNAVFKINGAIVATITTNIPTTSSRVVGAGIMGLKSLGITATAFWLGDYQTFEQLLAGRT